METALVILSTGIASSVLTLFGAYLFYRVYLEKHLDREIDKALEVVKVRLREGFT
ncbi:MAG: hypothetical protein HY042_09150, partial [Spirochaetia bacterium]|nr:hypothetical protein [Spirochaetia bacterium]